jgi:hypothetical protein
MRVRLAFGLLLLAGFGTAVTTSAGKPAAPKEIPVAVEFADRTGVDRIQSDGLGTYANGTSGVTAVIVPLGNLQLKTGTARTFSLDFTDCDGELGSCSAPFDTDSRQGYMTTSCPTALPSMTVGASQFCNLNVHFTYNQQGWFIRFGQGQGYDTTPATVTRHQDGSWTIDVPADGKALLESYPLKGRVTWTDHGDFYMPVHLTVTLQ